LQKGPLEIGRGNFCPLTLQQIMSPYTAVNSGLRDMATEVDTANIFHSAIFFRTGAAVAVDAAEKEAMTGVVTVVQW